MRRPEGRRSVFDRVLEQADRGAGPVSTVGLSPCLRWTAILVRRVDVGVQGSHGGAVGSFLLVVPFIMV